jgi:hypothetical protein
LNLLQRWRGEWRAKGELAFPGIGLGGAALGQIPDLQNAKWWAITNQVICDLMVVKSAAVDTIVALAAAPRNAWENVSPWPLRPF